MTAMKRVMFIWLLVAGLSFLAVSSVKAAPDPFANIRVIPVGSTTNGEPIIANSPADLIIYVTTAQHSPTKNVWLLIALNKPTYDAIDNITAVGVDVSVTFEKARFVLAQYSNGQYDPARIPPEAANGPYDPTYPGCTNDDQHATSAVGEKVGGKGEDVYYAYEFFKDSITKTPYEFTVTLNVASSMDVSLEKALVLAFGRAIPDDNGNYYGLPFDIHTPYSGSTLVVPELAPILLTLSSFGALGLYAIRRRK